jgi:hypothetical protein
MSTQKNIFNHGIRDNHTRGKVADFLAEKIAQLLDNLVTTWENEVVDFKQASNGYSTDDIGKYFSALANEANLRGTAPVFRRIF